MTLQDVQKQDLLQTRAIADACADSPATLQYVITCLHRFFAGDYGAIRDEDTKRNNAELAAGYGHILARYKARYNLEDDIYIEAMFDKDTPGIDSNYTMVMFCGER